MLKLERMRLIQDDRGFGTVDGIQPVKRATPMEATELAAAIIGEETASARSTATRLTPPNVANTRRHSASDPES